MMTQRFKFNRLELAGSPGAPGVLLVFAGIQLAVTIMDPDRPKDYFVATLILGITLASNLAAGFIAGMLVAWLLRWENLSVWKTLQYSDQSRPPRVKTFTTAMVLLRVGITGKP
jgi:hypothetical protein